MREMNTELRFVQAEERAGSCSLWRLHGMYRGGG